MVKQISVPCTFRGVDEPSPVNLYIGAPMSDKHPLEFQSKWLGEKGGAIPQALMNNLKNIHELSLKNGVNFEELCFYLISNKPIDADKNVSSIDLNKYMDEFNSIKDDNETDETDDESGDQDRDSDEAKSKMQEDNMNTKEQIVNQSEQKVNSIISDDDFDLLSENSATNVQNDNNLAKIVQNVDSVFSPEDEDLLG